MFTLALYIFSEFQMPTVVYTGVVTLTYVCI